jgi:hypothetical protein
MTEQAEDASGERCRLVCPECEWTSVETMPTDACVFFHECGGCAAMLRPRPGDCCVFCSYGDRPCPPRSQGV